MKCIAICFIFAVTLTCCLAKRCQEAADCDDGQCCVARWLGLAKGDCKNFLKLDDSCNSGGIKVFQKDQYILHCPCAPGTACEPTEVKDIPFIGTIKINEKCVEGTTTIKHEESTLPPTYNPYSTSKPTTSSEPEVEED